MKRIYIHTKGLVFLNGIPLAGLFRDFQDFLFSRLIKSHRLVEDTSFFPLQKISKSRVVNSIMAKNEDARARRNCIACDSIYVWYKEYDKINAEEI